MADPSHKSSIADNRTAFADYQGPKGGLEFSGRLTTALAKKGWKTADLARESGVPAKRLSDYVRGPKVPSAEYLFPMAAALDVSAEWLALGVEPQPPKGLAVQDADDADWIWVPRFDLRRLNDEGKGAPIDTSPMRKDWLKATVGFSSELWVAAMLADYPAAEIEEGDLVFCREIEPVELQDRQLCLFRVNGALLIARYSAHPTNAPRPGDGIGEVYVMFSQIGTGDDQYVPVARILAKFLQRF